MEDEEDDDDEEEEEEEKKRKLSRPGLTGVALSCLHCPGASFLSICAQFII